MQGVVEVYGAIVGIYMFYSSTNTKKTAHKHRKKHTELARHRARLHQILLELLEKCMYVCKNI